MKGCSKSTWSWISRTGCPLITLGCPLPNPPPNYSRKAEELQGYFCPSVLGKDWSLPLIYLSITPAAYASNLSEFYAHIAYALLSGEIFTAMLEYKGIYKYKLGLLRQRGCLLGQVTRLVGALQRENISCRRDLLLKWKEEEK